MFETHGIGQTPSSRARHLLLVILVSVLISYKNITGIVVHVHKFTSFNENRLKTFRA